MKPIPYDPSFEILEKDEAETAAALAETMLTISEKTYEDAGHATRSVHAKGHALLRGTLTVLPDLPPDLKQGLFAVPGTYETIMRLSTTPGDILDDAVTTPHGLALKIIGVPGERVEGSEGDTTQDFVMVNGPAFQVEHVKDFLKNLKLLAVTTDRGESLKIALSAAMRGVEAVIEAAGMKSAAITGLGGQQLVHPLGDIYYTQVPILFEPYMAKISLAPVSPNLTALTNRKLKLDGRKDALREEIAPVIQHEASQWELRVQLCTDIDAMPIENPAKVWPEDMSPYVAVARLDVPAQESWRAGKSIAMEDALSFNPWHALAAHRPLGAVMRVRKPVYAASVKFRGARTGCPMHEPRGQGDLAT